MKFLAKTAEELKAALNQQYELYKDFQRQKLSLDMSRGKPCKAQLDLSMPMFDLVNSATDFKMSNGFDARNYGVLEGAPECRKLFAEFFDVKPSQVLLRDSSSLNIMYDTVQYALQYGTGGCTPWNKQGKIKFICPSPGYDRHFGICKSFGIEMVTVPMTENGPDMNIVEMLAASDASIKGIWCTPKYSNPTGITYSDEVVDRLARMKTAAPDFRIFWDNAYFTHFIYDRDDKLKNLIHECEKAGNPDRVYMFVSTAKITFAGAGVAAFIASENTINEVKSHLTYQTICANKINQFIHAEFLKSKDNLVKHMRLHADIMRPKFDIVISTLEREFGSDCDIVNWIKPNGGYFVSVNVFNGCAKRVVELAKEAGVIFTNAGATYPNGVDDRDSNIRIAPSFPTESELITAMKVFACAAKIAAFEKLAQNS